MIHCFSGKKERCIFFLFLGCFFLLSQVSVFGKEWTAAEKKTLEHFEWLLTLSGEEQIKARFGADVDFAENARIRELLKKALEKNETVCYQTAAAVSYRYAPDVTGRFFRWVDPDGFVWKRTDLYRQGVLVRTFLQNRSGQYGIEGSNAVKIGEVPLLTWLEHINEPINKNELANSLFSLKESSYLSIPCYRITMKTNDTNFMILASFSGVPYEGEMEKPNGWFLKNRPMIREFLIGRDNGVIYSRKQYNLNGNLLFSRDLGDVEFVREMDMTLFDTPENISAQVAYHTDFEGLCWQRSLARENSFSLWRVISGVPVSIGNWLFSPKNDWFSSILIVCGVGLLLFVCYWKIKTSGASLKR